MTLRANKARHNMALYLTAEHWDYLDRCAQIRDIRPNVLVNELLEAIAKDQMVVSVLDDEGEQRANRPAGRHGYRRVELNP